MECSASGQQKIWELTSELLVLKSIPWKEPTLGILLSCGMPNFKDHRGKPMLGKNRLYTIIMSESMHLIWKLRCEWRIAREEDNERALTEPEIKRKWLNAINVRLMLDCLMTDKNRYGKKGLHPNIVLHT